MNKQIQLTSAALSKDNLCFMETISKKAKFTGGKKLSRSSIIRTLVEVSKKLNIDVSKVKTEKELENRFTEALRCYGKSWFFSLNQKVINPYH